MALGSGADALVAGLDSALSQAAGFEGTSTADAFAVFNNPTPEPPKTEYSDICHWTLMCSPPPPTPTSDIHPSTIGYHVLARIFLQASGL